MFVIELVYKVDLATIDAKRRAHSRSKRSCARDPFVARGLADDRLIELRASQRADDLPKRIA
jgi:hypothetical protein